MDENIHPATIYFPLIVHEAFMVEPTESETKAVLDNFINVMKKVLIFMNFQKTLQYLERTKF